MPGSRSNAVALPIAGALGLALAGAPLVAVPASAAPDGSDVVISEAYLNGGSNGATFTNKFVELYNPTDAAIDLSTYSLQYRATGGTGNPTSVFPLTGTIAPDGHYLVQGGSNGASGAALPTPDAIGASINLAGGGGTVFLVDGTTALTAPPTGSITAADDTIVDLLGYGTSNTFEATAAPAASLTTTISRTAGADTDVNSADFVAGAPTPTNAAGDTYEEPVEPPVEPPVPGDVTPIADIQGTTDASPLAGQTVTTRGVVTASYPTGGFNGYYIQTPGTGGTIDGSSDAIFVFSAATVAQAPIGSYVEVTGAVSEYQGLTEITVAAGGLSVVVDAAAAPVPAAVTLTADAAQRESLEGMLLAPSGDYTVTDNYDTNFYGSVVLAPGTAPLVQPTVLFEPGSPEFSAQLATNLASAITLDDGSSTNFNNAENKGTPLPYLSTTAPVRIGAAVDFTTSVVLDYRFGGWALQPLQQLTAANAATVQPATFENTRTDSPENVGGEATLATFNVLNYFSTTGDELDGCTYFTDRANDPVTVRDGCDARGAAEQEDLDRQQTKIVAAINSLDADVVGLEEIENSLAFGPDRDAALSELTDALNADAGAGTWSFVESPADLPADEDVIRTAFIYKSDVIETVGDSVILDDETAFSNAREPLAQAFQLVDDEESQFLAIVNHFKSKGSGTGPGDADAGDGQGASNGSRVRQATALVEFADGLKADTGIDRVFLAGDFNAYLKEDPIEVLTEAGYVDLGSTYTDEETYSFDGAIGSLDHVFASEEAVDTVAGVDIWNINSVESIALEYSRFNYNATNFYEPNAFRSSDHDPIIVGLDLSAAAGDVVDLNLLNINDFHGRIDENTVKFAGTIEQLREEGGEDNTLFLSSGDNIGASLFASSSQEDVPTLEVLNALLLRTSAVGNHEFDGGYDDLVGPTEDRESGPVTDIADFSYLGANVYNTDGTPALQEYDIFEVDGVRIAVIGAVTQQTPALVSQSGIAGLTFGDPVEAVNRVVDELVTDDAADVFIAEYHEGASAVAEGDTIEDQLAVTDSAFTSIVTETSAEVDAIFNGHTHQQYAWDAPVPGEAGVTRPVLQTGSYGENIGQIVLSVDTATDEVVDYIARNVPRISAPEGETDEETEENSAAEDARLVAEYPRVAEVQEIVNAALAEAAEIGNMPVAEISADITTAYIGDERDDRGSESTLGNLVADSLLASLSSPELGGAEIGVANPGGLRADLLYEESAIGEGDGIVTFAEANAVLPFVNNLYTTTLTGEQFRTVLEQQWQTAAPGEPAPSRPFLNLGLSDNVTYTFDPDAAQGSHITGIFIDGEPIDPAAEYRIGSFSFLLEGGDNFREFANGTDPRDSGLIDRDAWIEYLSTNGPLDGNSPVSPSFDRRGVAVTGVPAERLSIGANGTVDLSGLDLTSLGSPANTTVSAVFEGSAAAPVVSPVAAGAASVAFTVPDDALPAGTEGGVATLVITAPDSGTVVRVPIEISNVTAPVDPGTGGNGDPDGDGVGNGSGSGNGDDDLAFTGADIGSAAAIGALLLMLGAGLTVARLRQRRQSLR